MTAYAVRAYDMRARRLFQEPVVDPSEPDEDMSGVPLSRVSDAEGRWAYTLYSGASTRSCTRSTPSAARRCASTST